MSGAAPATPAAIAAAALSSFSSSSSSSSPTILVSPASPKTVAFHSACDVSDYVLTARLDTHENNVTAEGEHAATKARYSTTLSLSQIGPGLGVGTLVDAVALLGMAANTCNSSVQTTLTLLGRDEKKESLEWGVTWSSPLGSKRFSIVMPRILPAVARTLSVMTSDSGALASEVVRLTDVLDTQQARMSALESQLVTERTTTLLLLKRIEALEAKTVGRMRSLSPEVEFPAIVLDGVIRSNPLPSSIPIDAREICLYVSVQSGATDSEQSGELKIMTESTDAKTPPYSAYVTMHTSTHHAWSYNSDMLWLPITSKRAVAACWNAAPPPPAAVGAASVSASVSASASASGGGGAPLARIPAPTGNIGARIRIIGFK